MARADLRSLVHFQRRAGRKRILAPNGSANVPSLRPHRDGTLVKPLAQAWRWQKLLDHGVYASVRNFRVGADQQLSYL